MEPAAGDEGWPCRYNAVEWTEGYYVLLRLHESGWRWNEGTAIEKMVKKERNNARKKKSRKRNEREKMKWRRREEVEEKRRGRRGRNEPQG